MKVFKEYLKYRRFTILVILFCGVISTCLFYLYSYDLSAIVYSYLLCGFFLVVVGIYDYHRFYKKHNELRRAVKDALLSLDALPKSANIIEKDYARVVESLYKQMRLLEDTHMTKNKEFLDYYTMWVHQIKTPIAAMHLVLQNEPDNKNEIENQLFKIEQYADMVISFLRSESLASDLVIKPYNLNDIIRQAVHKYTKVFIRSGLKLNYEPITVSVITDEKWLGFVIEQLLSNAIKYTPKGEISIYMEGQGSKILVIEDTGIGIEKEDIPRVFERSFTGYNGRKDRKSSGIGLYLSKRILDTLGHKIEIESESGKGTKVKLKLDSAALKFE